MRHGGDLREPNRIGYAIDHEEDTELGSREHLSTDSGSNRQGGDGCRPTLNYAAWIWCVGGDRLTVLGHRLIMASTTATVEGRSPRLHDPRTPASATSTLSNNPRERHVTDQASWKPLFIGAVITGDDRVRLYFRSPERNRTYGVDVLISHAGPGLLGAMMSPAFLASEHLHQPSDDPHCDVRSRRRTPAASPVGDTRVEATACSPRPGGPGLRVGESRLLRRLGLRSRRRSAAARHGLRTSRAATAHQNVASQKVLSKAGFVPVGPVAPAHLDGKPGTWYQRDLTLQPFTAALSGDRLRDGRRPPLAIGV
jgi:hypothetical protein